MAMQAYPPSAGRPRFYPERGGSGSFNAIILYCKMKFNTYQYK